MERARLITIGVVAGVLVSALGMGAVWWIGSAGNRPAPKQSPELAQSGNLGAGSGGSAGSVQPVAPSGTAAGSPQAPTITTPTAPTSSAAPAPAPWGADQPAPAPQVVPQLQLLPPATFSVSVEPLPAGAIKHESMDESRAVTLNEPGIVMFHLDKGWANVSHWSRDLSYYGATAVENSFWGIVRGGSETASLMVALVDGPSYRVRGGEPLWVDFEGAIFLIEQQNRFGLLLTDPEFKPISAAWVSDEYRYSDRWQRYADGTFHFHLRDGEYSVNFQTGVVAAHSSTPYRLEQRNLLTTDCGDWGYGHQVKVYQGEQVRYSVLDAVAPIDSAFRGSLLLSDGKRAVIGTNNGPAVLDLTTGSLKGAPELTALGSPYLLASPGYSEDVASIPVRQADGSYRLRVGRIGQPIVYRDWTLRPGAAPSGTELRVRSAQYWIDGGTYLQVAVSYPPLGGKCGGPTPTDTHLNPVVVKGDLKGSPQVRVKAPVSLYAIQGEKLGTSLRTVEAQTVLSVRRIEALGNRAYALVVGLPEGEGALLVDPSRLEWVLPANS